MAGATEAELLAAAQGGSAEALQALVARHSEAVLRLCLSLLDAREHIEACGDCAWRAMRLAAWVMNQGMDKPEEIKQEIKQRLAALPADDLQRRHDSLADFNVALKALESVKADLKRAKEADDEVRPYLIKFDRARDAGDARALYDEVRSLIDRHGRTRWRPKLEEIRRELEKRVTPTATWVMEWVPLQAAVGSERSLAAALKLIDDFGTKWNESDDALLHARLEAQRAAARRRIK